MEEVKVQEQNEEDVEVILTPPSRAVKVFAWARAVLNFFAGVALVFAVVDRNWLAITIAASVVLNESIKYATRYV